MPELTSAETCVKYIVFIFNFIFWLAGTALLAIALWLRFDKSTADLFTVSGSPSTFLTGVYVLIVAAALMMVVGFLGCYGAIRESPLMLGLFFMFLFIIFIGEVAAGIWALSNKDTIVQEVKQFYIETHTRYLSTKQEVLKDALRVFQYSLQCCGTTGTIFDGATDTCPPQKGLSQLVTTSCPAAIDDMFNSRLHIIGGVGIGIGVVMIFGMITSMMLLCAIKRNRNVV